MRSFGRLGAAAVAATLAFGAVPAAAAVFTVTYQGTVVSGGYDNFGLFGVGANLSDQAFTLTFKVDTGTPGAGPGAAGAGESYFEGVGAASPVAGSMTIGGVTVLFGDYSGYDYRYDNALVPGCASDCAKAGMEQGALTRVEDYGEPYYYKAISGYGNAYGYTGQFSGLSHVATPSYDDAAAYFFGGFSVEEYSYSRDRGERTDINDVNASLKISSVTVTSAVVPEPATWALMVLGLGGAGVALRRRRASAAVASA